MNIIGSIVPTSSEGLLKDGHQHPLLIIHNPYSPSSHLLSSLPLLLDESAFFTAKVSELGCVITQWPGSVILGAESGI